MVNIKLNVGDPKSKKTHQLELDEQASVALRGKKLGATFKGELVDKPGYEFTITGGSDAAGFPMRKDSEGEGRRKVLIMHSVGNRATRKGMRLRRTVAGNTVSAATVQLNVKVTKHGAKPLVEEKPKEEKKE
jgi:small subunit ribosomal protein S6e